MMPPRHGKSELCSKYFPAWYLGMHPNDRIILTSYEADFARHWGRRARNILEEDGGSLFGVNIRSDSHAADRWDILGTDGGMFTAGAGGPITGRGADVAIIDDPIKNAEDANSETIREKIWDWYHSTFATRLHKQGRIIIIATRWHEDDLIGRLLKEQPDKWDVIKYTAIAERDEDWGTWSRKEGDPLCNELIPLEQLKEHMHHEYWWSALYQQRPYPRGGGLFKREDFEIVSTIPQSRIKVRAWDLAASEKKDAKRTAGVLLSKDAEGVYYVEDAIIGKWSPGKRDAVIKQTAQLDGRSVVVKIEQEPGSGGIAQVDSIIRSLNGFSVEGVPITGDKISRADPVASQAGIKNIKILQGSWNQEFLREIEAFPQGTYKDQVDALSLAFNYLAQKKWLAPTRPVRFEKDWRDEIPDMGMGGGEDWRDRYPI
jgi:predicted phage terminase large subunit-like protein